MNKDKIAMVARILLGLMFFVFGLNGFLQFIPAQPMPEAAMKFGMALAETGYMFPMIKGLETLCGLALLVGWFVPLALIVLAPIVVNIFMFHFCLAPEGMLVPIVVVALMLFLGHYYRATFKSVLKKK